MSELANVSIENADRLIFDTGPNGLDSLQRATDFPAGLISVMRLMAKLALKMGYGGGRIDHTRFYINAMKTLDKKFGGWATRNLGGLLNNLAQSTGIG